MKKLNAKKFSKVTLTIMGGALFLSGTYNTFIFNSKSFSKHAGVKLVKRLDELEGEVIKGKRENNWKDLTVAKANKVIKAKPLIVEAVPVRKIVEEKPIQETVRAVKPLENQVVSAEPIIRKRLDLGLKEFYNAKLFKKPLTAAQFSGSLYTNDGMIESLEVSLPGGKSINVSYAEMRGNIFQYEVDGEQYSGMIYEAGKGNYMVNLTNGPFADTRMKFVGEESEVEADRNIANDENRELDKAQEYKEITDEAVEQFENEAQYNDEEVAEVEEFQQKEEKDYEF